RSEHFLTNGIRIEYKTNVGYFTIEALDLNRLTLRKLREIRQRLTNCASLVSQGIMGLRTLRIDQLHPSVRGRAVTLMKGAEQVADNLEDKIDAVLKAYAKSDLLADLADDPEGETRARERVARLSDFKHMYPGSWRAPRATKRQS